MNVIEHISSKVLLPISILGIDLSITNETAVLFAAVALILLFFYFAGKAPKVVPGRLQNLAEIYISALWDTLEPVLHDKAWLPFFVALFSIIFFCNLIGQLPGVVPPTANINFTGALALIVFMGTHIFGIMKNGAAKYASSFVPRGIPWPITVFIVPLELISQLVRPFSLAIRLFANIFAGHAVVLSIVGLVFVFKSSWVIPGTLLGQVLISMFEVFVAFIQAFIFTFLSAFYIGGALETEHQ